MSNFLLAQLTTPNADITLILPEIVVAFAGIVVMLYDSFFPKQKAVSGAIGMLGILISALLLVLMWGDSYPGTAWSGMIAHDNLRLSFGLVFLMIIAMTILASTLWVEIEGVPIGEFHALLLFATFGMMMMAAGNDLVVIFLGLETSSIATYVMAGLRKGDLRSNESALKYFVLGSFASAFLLYGMALVYGATGTTNIPLIAASVGAAKFPALLLIGSAMMIVGFGFKVALAPFHVWTPDVYEGAPAPITGFMAAGPKAAAFASFVRVFVLGFPLVAGAQAAGILHETWTSLLAVLGIITIIFGNVAAILQNNIKRMLAYSSIAHAGYATVGFIGAGLAKTAAERNEAIAAVAFYLFVYAITNLGAFAIVSLLGQRNDRRAEFEDYNGIGFKAPLLSFSLSVFMLSLLGMPLTAGFIGKVLVFRPALESGNVLVVSLVVVAVIGSAISAYYYLRLLVVMFFRERAVDWTPPRVPSALTTAIAAAVLAVLYFGLFSNGLIHKFAGTAPKAAEVRAER